MQETIVLYPAPGLGHVLSMVELGKVILQHRNNQISINILLTTGFWDTPSITSYTNSVSQAHPSISFLRFPSISVDIQNSSPAAINFRFIRLHAPNALHSLQDISKTHKISAFVIDLFCTSTLSLVKDLKIPTFYFYTSSASALAAFFQFPKLDEQTTESFKDLRDTVFHFHGAPPLKAVHMPGPLLDRQDPAYHDFMYFCSGLPQSDGIIVNTFEDLEPISIKTIADGSCLVDAPTPPTFYIGPLIAAASSSKAENDYCLSWLEKQPSQSVVFLCFGSRGTFSRAQLKEIAKGLERSGHRFLWVVKNPPEILKAKQAEESLDVDLEFLLPEGFMERTKDRGLVVKSFAPQVAVLNKDSVGGFVTHCGWNSILEAVVAGVPMIAWPLYAEQHLNRNILVEDMKMAIPVEQREGDGFVSGTELEKRVRELIESDNGKELRARSWKMREKALAAWGPSGSSTKAVTKLIELWKQG
ncbi:hypothetical protein PTKIN_Ptkin09bG0079600 [Pterospermum kingtungense]